MNKIIVVGSNGQLGNEIKHLSDEFPNFEFIFVARNALDLSHENEIYDFFSKVTCDAIINCSAYTAVDKAETDSENAEKINHTAVSILAQIANEKKIKLIHVSTDYVFDGKSSRPYNETNESCPSGVYGKTKQAGELAIQAIAPPNAVIIRTSWLYSSYGNNFVKTMIRLASERDSINVVADQIGTPTYARDLARAILEIIPKISNIEPAIYHYSNEGVASWYDFAKAIFEISNSRCMVNPIRTEQYPTPALRPAFSVLDKTKIKTEFGIKIPYWRDSLGDCLRKLEVTQ